MTQLNRISLGFLAAALLALGATAQDMKKKDAAAPGKISYDKSIRPIFQGVCVGCHQPGGEGAAKSGLDLTSYAGVMKGTKFGPMIIPGDPESSNLMLLLDWRASPELRMPHGMKQLNSCDRNDIRAWIREGAKDN